MTHNIRLWFTIVTPLESGVTKGAGGWALKRQRTPSFTLQLMIMYVLWFQIIVHMSFEVLAGASIENLTTNNTFTNCMTFTLLI